MAILSSECGIGGEDLTSCIGLLSAGCLSGERIWFVVDAAVAFVLSAEDLWFSRRTVVMTPRSCLYTKSSPVIPVLLQNG